MYYDNLTRMLEKNTNHVYDCNTHSTKFTFFSKHGKVLSRNNPINYQQIIWASEQLNLMVEEGCDAQPLFRGCCSVQIRTVSMQEEDDN